MSEPVKWACASCGERNIAEPHRCRVKMSAPYEPKAIPVIKEPIQHRSKSSSPYDAGGLPAPSPSPPTSGVGAIENGYPCPCCKRLLRLDKSGEYIMEACGCRKAEGSVDVAGWLRARSVAAHKLGRHAEQLIYREAADAYEREFGRNDAPINQKESK